MTENKQVSKEKTAMTSREKILKYCQVIKKPMQLGNVLVYGKHEYRMNKTLDELTDGECNRVLGKLNALWGVEKNATEGKRTPAKRRAVVSVESKLCECDCGEMTRKGSRFLPGHDMKLKSRLRKAGTPEAKAELKKRGWA